MPDSYFQLSTKDQASAIDAASNACGRAPHLLEKDIWVVWALSTLFQSELGMRTGTIDQFSNPSFPELAQGCVGGKSSSPARPFKRPVNLIARVHIVCQIGGPMGNRATVRFTIPNEGISTIVRDIEPLVPVCCPGLRHFRPSRWG